MIVPGIIVDAFGQLRENIHILRSEIELAVWTAKIKALVLPKLSRSVLPSVPA